MNTLQTHFWAVRDYLAPVLRESKFKEHGRITPEEFVAAGDFLAYKFPTWAWSAGESSKAREYLPKDKQYLISRGVPCLRRVSQMERAAVGGSKSGLGSASQDSGERMLSFAEGEEGGEGKGNEDDWLATHLDGSHPSATAQDIADIPDSEPPAELTAGEEDDLAARVAGTNLVGGAEGAGDIVDESDDIGDIPDMGDEDDIEGLGAGVVEEEDPAAKQNIPSSSTDASAGSNIVSVRTYDCLITYDKYYQTPRMWLFGYDESGVPLKPVQIFEDVSSDYAQKTVTIEPFPHAAGLSTASVHPCKHASVMRKVIERMDGTVREEQRKAKVAGGAAGIDEADKKKKKGWAGLGGAVRKVTGKEGSGSISGTSTPGGAAEGQEATESEVLEVEGLRVDQYLIIFLKFMASIVPAIEIDATQAV